MTFLPQEVIARKRDGEPLTPGEIRSFIAGFADGTVSHAQAAAFAMAVYFRDMTLDESVALTEAMRDSGDGARLVRSRRARRPTSTRPAAIGDNVSLMLAPILAACGVYVPMISGRGLGHSGGTLDKLDSIPGLHDRARQRAVPPRGARGRLRHHRPDRRPRPRRQDCSTPSATSPATVESIPLITGSILSKKLAAGLGSLILDVKTGSGAFMPTLERVARPGAEPRRGRQRRGPQDRGAHHRHERAAGDRRRQRARGPQRRRFPHRRPHGRPSLRSDAGPRAPPPSK